jgi:hypothetical protein
MWPLVWAHPVRLIGLCSDAALLGPAELKEVMPVAGIVMTCRWLCAAEMHCIESGSRRHLQLGLWVWVGLFGDLGSALNLLKEGAPLPPLVLLECRPQQVNKVRHIINVHPLHGERMPSFT